MFNQFTLDPGDALFMGASSGAGAAMKPPCFLKKGGIVSQRVPFCTVVLRGVLRVSAMHRCTL